MTQLYSAIGVVDTWIVIIYIGIIVGIGIYCSYFIKSSTDYSSAGQNLGMIVIIGATMSSFFGAYTGSGGPEAMHAYGMVAFNFTLAGNVGLLGLALMGRRLRRSGALTYPQYLVMNYGENTRLAISVISMIYLIGQVAGQFVACGTVAALLGLCSFQQGILIGGVIIILLTVFGGLVSVAWTGAVQQIFITILCAFFVPIIAIREAGGLSAIWEFNGPVRTSLVQGMPMGYLIGMFLSIALSFAAEPAYAQRVFCAKDEKTAVWGNIVANILSLIVTIPLYIAALSHGMLFPDIGGSAFVPSVIYTFMPPVIKGFGIAAFISLLLTTADTMLMTTASIFSTDIWPILVPKASDKTTLLAGRIFVAAMGILAIIMGLFFESVYTVMLLFSGAYGSAVFPCILIAVLYDKKRGNNPIHTQVVPFAIVSTFVITAAMDLIPTFPTEGVYIGLPLNILILIIGSKIVRSRNTPSATA